MSDNKKQVPFAPAAGAPKLEHPSIVVPGPTMPMHFPCRVLLTLPNYRVVEFREGIQQVPESLMKHPYLLAHGVKPYHVESYGEMQARVEQERLTRDAEIQKQQDLADETAKVKERVEVAVKALVDKGNSEETSRRIVSEIGPDMALEQLANDSAKAAAELAKPLSTPAPNADPAVAGAPAVEKLEEAGKTPQARKAKTT